MDMTFTKVGLQAPPAVDGLMLTIAPNSPMNGELGRLSNTSAIIAGTRQNDSRSTHVTLTGPLFQTPHDVLNRVRQSLDVGLHMGEVIHGNFGGGKPVKPPEKPPRAGDPGNMDPTLYRKYFHAFFNPDLNPYLWDVYSGDDFIADLRGHIATQKRTAAASKMRSQTYKDRAALILDMNAKGILGYLEKFVGMKLKGADVMALNLLIQVEKFVLKAGQAIYDARNDYGISLKDTDEVDETILGKLGKSGLDQIYEAIDGCPYTQARFEAVGEMERTHGRFSSPGFQKKLAETTSRCLKQAWMRREMVIKFRDLQLKDPFQISVVGEYVLEAYKELKGGVGDDFDMRRAIDFILAQETMPEPKSD